MELVLTRKRSRWLVTGLLQKQKLKLNYCWDYSTTTENFFEAVRRLPSLWLFSQIIFHSNEETALRNGKHCKTSYALLLLLDPWIRNYSHLLPRVFRSTRLLLLWSSYKMSTLAVSLFYLGIGLTRGELPCSQKRTVCYRVLSVHGVFNIMDNPSGSTAITTRWEFWKHTHICHQEEPGGLKYEPSSTSKLLQYLESPMLLQIHFLYYQEMSQLAQQRNSELYEKAIHRTSPIQRSYNLRISFKPAEVLRLTQDYKEEKEFCAEYEKTSEPFDRESFFCTITADFAYPGEAFIWIFYMTTIWS